MMGAQAKVSGEVSSTHISLNFPCGLGVSICLVCPCIHWNGDSSMSQSQHECKGFRSCDDDSSILDRLAQVFIMKG